MSDDIFERMSAKMDEAIHNARLAAKNLEQARWHLNSLLETLLIAAVYGLGGASILYLFMTFGR